MRGLLDQRITSSPVSERRRLRRTWNLRGDVARRRSVDEDRRARFVTGQKLQSNMCGKICVYEWKALSKATVDRLLTNMRVRQSRPLSAFR